jgi:Ca2+-binding EF-hand superfamily protein
MLSPDAVSRLTQVFKMFDKNADGKLDDGERTAMMAFVKNFQERQQKRDQ